MIIEVVTNTVLAISTRIDPNDVWHVVHYDGTAQAEKEISELISKFDYGCAISLVMDDSIKRMSLGDLKKGCIIRQDECFIARKNTWSVVPLEFILHHHTKVTRNKDGQYVREEWQQNIPVRTRNLQTSFNELSEALNEFAPVMENIKIKIDLDWIK